MHVEASVTGLELKEEKMPFPCWLEVPSTNLHPTFNIPAASAFHVRAERPHVPGTGPRAPNSPWSPEPAGEGARAPSCGPSLST